MTKQAANAVIAANTLPVTEPQLKPLVVDASSLVFGVDVEVLSPLVLGSDVASLDSTGSSSSVNTILKVQEKISSSTFVVLIV